LRLQTRLQRVCKSWSRGVESWSGVVESWPGVAVHTVPGVARCGPVWPGVARCGRTWLRTRPRAFCVARCWSGPVWPGVHTVPGVAVCINAPNITNDGPVHFPIDGVCTGPHSGSCQRGDAGTVDRGKARRSLKTENARRHLMTGRASDAPHSRAKRHDAHGATD